MSDKPPTQTIDDFLPSCFEKQPDGSYKATGVVTQFHTEPGYVFATLCGKNDERFFTFREEPAAVQNEMKRADLSFYVCGIKSSMQTNTSVIISGELLPIDFAPWKIGNDRYRGIRMEWMEW